MNGRVLILTPEAPYPLHSGGAYRTASLVHYFSRLAEVDLILLSESGQPALLPRGLVRSQQAIALPPNSRGMVARYARNAGRALRGVPPLIDRLSGFEEQIRNAMGDREYDAGAIEHFWCAPYVKQLKQRCKTTVLNLHNVESSLHARCAGIGGLPQRMAHRRFAGVSRRMERELLPQFNLVLATSDTDAEKARHIAPGAHVEVYPNALPTVPLPRVPEDGNRVVFSGNFEYHPNVDAVQYLSAEIWPRIRQQIPSARVRLVGRGEEFVRQYLFADSGMEATGAVANACDEIAQGAVVIAPLRAGSGTRIKILEAWSAGRAVVATPTAAEGLRVENGVNIVLASGAKEFAAAVVNLLGDPAARSRIGAAGRTNFERHYTWQVAWSTMDLHLQALFPAALGGYTG